MLRTRRRDSRHSAPPLFALPFLSVQRRQPRPGKEGPASRPNCSGSVLDEPCTPYELYTLRIPFSPNLRRTSAGPLRAYATSCACHKAIVPHPKWRVIASRSTPCDMCIVARHWVVADGLPPVSCHCELRRGLATPPKTICQAFCSSAAALGDALKTVWGTSTPYRQAGAQLALMQEPDRGNARRKNWSPTEDGRTATASPPPNWCPRVENQQGSPLSGHRLTGPSDSCKQKPKTAHGGAARNISEMNRSYRAKAAPSISISPCLFSASSR